MRPFGYHIVGGKNVVPSLEQTYRAGFTAAQIFLGPPQQPKVEIPEEEIKKFRALKESYGMKVFVHAPYVLHVFAKPENKVKNDHAVVKMVDIASQMGCDGYVLHMGGTKWYQEENAVDTPRHYYEPALALIHKLRDLPCPLLFENCASGNSMSGELQSICGLLDLLHTAGYTNTGLCLDTCHAWAWGYDIHDLPTRSFIASITQKHLKLVHLNSAPEKVKCGGGYDRHEAIHKGIIAPHVLFDLMVKLPNIPTIAEREEFSDILTDWSFVKEVDKAVEQESTR